MIRPFLLLPLCILHLFLGVGALFGGLLLLLKPDGSLLGMNPDWLSTSPFNSYLFPGLILFTLNGLLPLFTVIGLIAKPNWPWANTLNIYTDKHWAWTYSLYSGIIIIIWITVQLMMTQYFWLQPVMILTGILILIITLTPSIIKSFNKE